MQGEATINFISIAFECVRFDVKNLDIVEKKQIAEKMNIFLLQNLQIHRN